MFIRSIFLAIALSLTAAAPASGQNFQKGMTAYKSGDYETALREWTPLAEQGDADAQINLGRMYDNGEGVAEDNTEAVRWFRLAAE